MQKYLNTAENIDDEAMNMKVFAVSMGMILD